MEELLAVYDENNRLVKIQARDSFYLEAKKELKSKGRITSKVKTIRVLLMNSAGRIYLQKRSKFKNDNAGLYDKTVGGHVLAGDTFDVTVIKECSEELGVPVAILSNEEFNQSIKNTNLSIVGLLKKVSCVKSFQSVRILKNKEKYIQPYINSFYIGYYDGALRFADGESSGIEVFSLTDLKQEIKEQPEKFTEDVKYIICKFEKYIKAIK